MRGWVTLALVFLLCNIISAQEFNRPDIDLERFIEEIFAVQNGDVSSEELFETLLLFYSDPINLNNTSEEELRSLFILNESQIQSFFNYTAKNGKLLSIYELQAIPDFDLITINKLLPFVIVRESGLNADSRSLWRRIAEEDNNYLLIRYETTLEEKRGFKPTDSLGNSNYVGGPGKIYTRFRTSHINDFSIGFTAEKDAGEELAWDPSNKQYGADFYSGHIQLMNQGKFKNIILGDYQMQFGQSLVFGSGFNVGKGAETITTVRRSNLGIRPYTSVIETNFFRGGAATYAITDKLEVTGFFSSLNQDANIQADTVEREDFITSIQQSGFHRTESEIRNRNTVEEVNYGGALLYSDRAAKYSLGANILVTELSQNLQRADRLYNAFEFKGTSNYTGSIFGDYSWQNFNVFGEVATSKSGGFGLVAGMIGSITSKLETSVVIRNYEKDFHTFYGNAFGESTRNINESGWYWGLKYTFSRKLIATAYFDSFSFPWLRSNINAPSSGYEYLSRITYKPTRSIILTGQFREESKANNLPSTESDELIRFPLEAVKRNYLVSVDFPANDILSFKSRVQWSSYDFNSRQTEGFAIWQDANLDFGKFKISGRIALFETDDFNNAQYAYERDVLYAFSVPAYNGIGTRQYVVVQYKPTRKLTFWAKYARTHYRDRDVISSGNKQIDGNIKTDIRIQARINF
ncbi:ComEA family DNA-binding protein [Fulvivirga lutea]|uniref:Helix-hairpin-helix domain-containing protein n=1 Tax=Fulvivirga lutea TaxID=2810512 RepID=A0A975A075_9BACT|nr:hypothetical protein [Fulvivirga lutea]QSE96951.1 hypothetical protein JR347_15320 [Fulvivirga lutea]